MSEQNPEIAIPFVKIQGPHLSQYRLQLRDEQEEGEIDGVMFAHLEAPPAPIDLASLISPELSPEDQSTLLTVLEEYQELFSGKLTRRNLFRHSITLTTSKPVASSPRRANPVVLTVIQKQTKSMHEKGLYPCSQFPLRIPRVIG